MKKNLRGKIREFVQSEEGKVGVKSPLTLGAAVGSVLLAQAIVGTPQAEARPCGGITKYVIEDFSAMMTALVIQYSIILRNGSDERLLPSSSLIISEEY